MTSITMRAPFERTSSRSLSFRPLVSIPNVSVQRFQRTAVTLTAGGEVAVPAAPPAPPEAIDWAAEAAVWGDETREWADGAFEAGSESWPTE